jgi:LPS export ABC transporter protein LptC
MKSKDYIYCSLFLFISLAQVACENDLRDVEEVSSKKVSLPVDKSTGVEIIYSDSAKVKAKLITPELLHYKTQNPYYEMKRGVTILFYNAALKENSRVIADEGIRRENEKRVELRHNVVATNERGEVFKSDELIWDEAKKKFTSSKMVSVTSDGNTIYGTSFWANENFSYYEITQSTGDLSLTDKQGF